MLIVAFI